MQKGTIQSFKPRSFDILLGADVICQASDAHRVASVSARLLSDTGFAIFVLGGSESRFGSEELPGALESHGLCVEHLPIEEYMDEFVRKNRTDNSRPADSMTMLRVSRVAAAEEVAKEDDVLLAALLALVKSVPRLLKPAHSRQQGWRILASTISPGILWTGFFVARRGNVGQAAHILTDSLAWREASGADVRLLNKDGSAKAREERVKRMYPYALHGTDTRGHVVQLERAAFCDIGAMKDDRRVEDLLQNHVYQNDKCLTRSPKRLVIMDLAGIGSRHLTKSSYALIKSIISIDQRHYPETLYKMYLVNSPWILTAAFAIIKQWLDPITLSKIIICGGPSEYLPLLRADLRNEDIPAFLGGQCRCGGGCVPIHPSLRSGLHALCDEQKLEAKAGKIGRLSVNVREGQLKVLWRTAAYSGDFWIEAAGTTILAPGKHIAPTKSRRALSSKFQRASLKSLFVWTIQILGQHQGLLVEVISINLAEDTQVGDGKERPAAEVPAAAAEAASTPVKAPAPAPETGSGIAMAAPPATTPWNEKQVLL